MMFYGCGLSWSAIAVSLINNDYNEDKMPVSSTSTCDLTKEDIILHVYLCMLHVHEPSDLVFVLHSGACV